MTGRKSKILIIGASGFIGSALTKKLLSEGANITALIGENGIRHLEGFQKQLKAYPYREVKGKLARLGDFKHVYNLSGHTDLKLSFKDPMSYEANKPLTTINLIENVKAEKFVNISTGSVYDCGNNPLSENSLLKPLSPYAISQLNADYYTEILCGYNKIPYLVLRLFNPYGPPNITRGFIPSVITRILRDKEVVLYNPQRRFDFTFIDDVIEAITFLSGKKNGIFNIGQGRPASLMEAFKLIKSFIGKPDLKPRIIRCRQETAGIVSDNSKLKRCGFRFKYDLDKGIKITINNFLESTR